MPLRHLLQQRRLTLEIYSRSPAAFEGPGQLT
jgi:hypothetical protein